MKSCANFSQICVIFIRLLFPDLCNKKSESCSFSDATFINWQTCATYNFDLFWREQLYKHWSWLTSCPSSWRTELVQWTTDATITGVTNQTDMTIKTKWGVGCCKFQSMQRWVGYRADKNQKIRQNCRKKAGKCGTFQGTRKFLPSEKATLHSWNLKTSMINRGFDKHDLLNSLEVAATKILFDQFMVQPGIDKYLSKMSSLGRSVTVVGYQPQSLADYQKNPPKMLFFAVILYQRISRSGGLTDQNAPPKRDRCIRRLLYQWREPSEYFSNI